MTHLGYRFFCCIFDFFAKWNRKSMFWVVANTIFPVKIIDVWLFCVNIWFTPLINRDQFTFRKHHVLCLIEDLLSEISATVTWSGRGLRYLSRLGVECVCFSLLYIESWCFFFSLLSSLFILSIRQELKPGLRSFTF